MLSYLTASQMQALERHAVEEYFVPLEQMMQNAGRAVFDVVMNEVLPEIHPTEGGQSIACRSDCRILVVSGKGNNGGDALVTAKLLAEQGIGVTVLSSYPIAECSPMARKQMEGIPELDIDVVESFEMMDVSKFKLIIDGLFGFSLKGDPHPPADTVIEQINCSKTPVLSVDVPSGLDVHNGSIGQPTVKADYTVALGLPKIGFQEYPKVVGKLYVGDLGIPEQAYRDMNYDAPMFRGKSYIFVN